MVSLQQAIGIIAWNVLSSLKVDEKRKNVGIAKRTKYMQKQQKKSVIVSLSGWQTRPECKLLKQSSETSLEGSWITKLKNK